MARHSMSGAVLAAGVAAASVCAFAIVRRRRARRSAAMAALREERWVGIEDDFEPDQLDSEDLQWRPRVGSSLPGPEDLEEPVELDFSELDATDVASAAVTVDMLGAEPEEGLPIAGKGGAERGKGHSATRPEVQRMNRQRANDELDWLDELDDLNQPPHRYR